MFERTMISLVAWSARKSAFNDYVFAPKRAVTVAAGWTENGDNGRTDSRGEMLRACVPAEKKFRRLYLMFYFL
jgi:hypothetical protein